MIIDKNTLSFILIYETNQDLTDYLFSLPYVSTYHIKENIIAI